MRLRLSIVALVMLALTCAPLAQAAAAKSKAPPYHYARLFYYSGGKAAKQAFLTHLGSIDIFAPQNYELQPDGSLSGTLDPDLLAVAKKHGIEIMPLVTNDGFSRSAHENILNDPLVQAEAIGALVTEAEDKGYWGWQVDFEQMSADNRDKFSAFIQNAAIAFHNHGLKLSVAVVAQTSENPDDYPNDLWQKLIGVYDYAALGAAADFVTVMSYDDPNSTGPVAGWQWYNDVLKWSLSKIPNDKLSLGLPLYYWQWRDSDGKRVGIGGNEGIDNVFKKHRVAVHYSAAEHAPYLHFYSHAVGYTLWYENSRSIADKVALVKKYKLYGFSAWALGLEVPSVYADIRESAQFAAK